MFLLASIPGAVSMLASALYQLLDGIFVGQFLGATPFAAVNLAMPFVIINFSLADAGPEALAMSIGALQLFAITYLTRWFSFATQSYLLAVEKSWQASVISVSTALIFPVVLVGVLWPLVLTGIWLNFAGTAVLAGILAAVLLLKLRPELSRPDEELPPKTR